MEKHIIDANIFFNMEAGLNLGKTSEEVIKKITHYAKKLKGEIEFLMPPRIVDEVLSFFPEKPSFVGDFLSALTVRSPDYDKTSFSGRAFYRLIDDIRTRSYRGLSIAEEEITKAAELMMGQSKLQKKDFQIKIGDITRKFRLRYRRATRFGFLDSTADLDLIVLTKETDGFLVSTDEGVITWGRFFGIKEMLPEAWKKRLGN